MKTDMAEISRKLRKTEEAVEYLYLLLTRFSWQSGRCHTSTQPLYPSYNQETPINERTLVSHVSNMAEPCY